MPWLVHLLQHATDGKISLLYCTAQGADRVSKSKKGNHCQHVQRDLTSKYSWDWNSGCKSETPNFSVPLSCYLMPLNIPC